MVTPTLTRAHSLRGIAACGAICVAVSGCFARPLFSEEEDAARPAAPPSPRQVRTPRKAEEAIFRSADREWARYLEREIERLRSELTEAEETMIAIESGLRGNESRADAVSALAEGRIAAERAARSAPWRVAELDDVQGKLEEAERQFQAGHTGSAIFFASRARRMAEKLSDEARQVSSASETRFVDSELLNLRSAPSTRGRVLQELPRGTPVFPERYRGRWVLVRTTSGPVGWVHGSLLSER